MNNNFKIVNFRTEIQETPLGIDVVNPRFSWEMESAVPGSYQSAYQIMVCREEDGEICWDSNKQEKSDSNEIFYEGTKLMPSTRYRISVSVWNQEGQKAEQDSWFETGLMDPSPAAWEGAEWIGSPEYALDASRRGVFVLEAQFRIEKGSSRAGLIFGANDERLLDRTLNEYFIEGENYICYEIDISKIPAVLNIYRVGYHPEDRKDVPLASVPVKGLDTQEPVLTEENRYEMHTITIEVTGNCAYTYIDGILVDGEDKMMWGNTLRIPRQLNPRGDNDVITYPRLNEIGFYAGPGDTAYFHKLETRNLRKPCGVIIQETPEGSLYGGECLFTSFLREGTLTEEDHIFCVKGGSQGAYITKNPSYGALPMLRRRFRVKSGAKIQKARLYAASRGIYECRLNGNVIGTDLFPPGNTQYDKHLLYQTYDITGELSAQDNVIGFTLASGWWSDAQTFALQGYNYWGDKESLLSKIMIWYEDGTREVIVTDTDNWKCASPGPWQYAGFFSGEHYDAAKAHIAEAYTKAAFSDADWGPAAVVKTERIPAYHTMPAGFGREWPAVNETEPEMIGNYQAPVTEVNARCAVSREEIYPGVYIYDFGQEMAGMPEISFKEESGRKIMLRYGEMKYPGLPEYGRLAGTLLYENYRDASSTDVYICRGDAAGETYRPRFTFHGYRYLEIRGAQNPPAPEEVVSIQISSIPEITGSFHCSNELVNRFVENVNWSQLCNFISVPTDCPQRNERMGWAGDTHVFTRTALMNSDARLFYYRNLQALKDLQTPEGQYPNIAPVGGGFGGITYESASFIILWELYLQCGDKQILAEHYEALCSYMEYLERKGMPGDVFVGPLGDWLAQEETDSGLLWNAFYAHDVSLMVKFSEILGKEKEAATYRSLEEKIKAYWNQTFVDPRTMKTRNQDGSLCDTQCSYALPLLYHVFSPEYQKAAGEHLNRKAAESGYRVMTGFFGTGALNEVLTQTGHPESAYKLMEQTQFPSWLYSVTQGATTIWERWNSFTIEKGFGGNNNMNSFNHYSLGSVKSWLYRHVLGIQPLETHPGYKRFLLKPQIMGFTHAEGKIRTMYGIIESSWRMQEDRIEYQCVVPANTSAVLTLPGMEEIMLASGNHCYSVPFSHGNTIAENGRSCYNTLR